MAPLIARPGVDRRPPQLLAAHLRSVAAKAARMGAWLGPDGSSDALRAMGLLHDVGKASPEAQAHLKEGAPKCDHATAGALLLWGLGLEGDLWWPLLGAYGLRGHHTGLADGSDLSRLHKAPHASTLSKPRSTLAQGLASEIPDWRRPQAEALAKEGTEKAKQATVSVSPPVNPAMTRKEVWASARYTMAFWGRMAAACLVAADHEDAAEFESGESRRKPAPLSAVREALEEHLAKLSRDEGADSPTNRWRREVSQEALSHAGDPQDIFRLSVDTGGGKTLCSLRFALAHAEAHGLRRVILAAPYMAIDAQTANELESFLPKGSLLRHWSDAGPEGEDDRYGARWDVPVVVTTHVQLLESLHAAKPSRVKKLADLAGSVIVVDEAQMVPERLSEASMRALLELVANYRCSVVLQTATQSGADDVLERWLGEGWRPTELVGEGLGHTSPRRRYSWDGTLELGAVARSMGSRDRSLAVLNTRKGAQALFELLPEGSRLCLTTAMTPGHRAEVEREVRRRLDKDEPVHLAATSLVECGCDFDFEEAWRELAGLDSVVQTGGRVNRHGSPGPEASAVHVFEPEDPGFLPDDLPRRREAARSVVLGLLAEGAGPSDLPLESPGTLGRYFSLLGAACASTDVGPHGSAGPLALMEGGFSAPGCPLDVPYLRVERAFRMIEDDAEPMAVAQRLPAAVLEGLESGRLDGAGWRAVSRESVPCHPGLAQRLLASGDAHRTGQGVLVLDDGYRSDIGLPL